MDLFPRVDLIRLPNNATGPAEAARPEAEKCLVVIYDGSLPFLLKVLRAAGYQRPEEQTYLIQRTAADAPLDLTGLLERLAMRRVMLFGQVLPELGIHFHLAYYFPATVGGRTYMCCEGVETIAAAKDRGNNQAAGALWRGIQRAFLCEETT